MRLWLGFLGAPAAWTAQLVIGYGLEEIGCASGWDPAPWIVLVTVAAAAVAVASTVTGRRLARAGAERVAFMGTWGVLWGGLFLLLIVLGGLQLTGLEACAR
jgi:hypothetical protein